jgi:MFS family permease
VTWFERAGFGRRRTFVLAAAGWLVAGGLVWNSVFDTMIVNAGREYVHYQQLYERKRGPAVTIEQVMGPAQAAALRIATETGLAVAGIGFVLTVYVAARLAARRRNRAATSAPSSTAGPR